MVLSGTCTWSQEFVAHKNPDEDMAILCSRLVLGAPNYINMANGSSPIKLRTNLVEL